VQDEVENSIEDTEATSGTQGFVNRMADVDRGGVIRSKTCPNDGAQAIHQHGLSHWVVITLAMRQGPVRGCLGVFGEFHFGTHPYEYL